MMHLATFIVTLNVFVIVHGYMHSLGSIEYCADLKQRTNITIPQIVGTWIGIDVITHRETGYGQKQSNDCIYLVIDEINQDVSANRQ